MGDEADEALWSLVVAGESDWYGVLWDRHRDRVFRHLLWLGFAPQDAEDLSAATFLELWRRRAHVRFVDGSLLPWLLATAHNLARNEARAQRRYRRFLAALPAPELAPDPAALVDGMDAARDGRVRAVLAAARPADGQLLALTAVEGFSVKDAAAVLGISESAAKMRLSRLRRRLALVVEARMVPEGDAS